MSTPRVCCHSQRVVPVLVCILGLILPGSTAQSEQGKAEPNSDGNARLRSIPGMMVDLRLEGPRQQMHYPSQALRLTLNMKNHGPEFMAPANQQCFELVVNERWYRWEHGTDGIVPDEARYSPLARGDSRSIEIALTGTGYPNAGRWHEEKLDYRKFKRLAMRLQFNEGGEYTIRLALPVKDGTRERQPPARVVSSPIRVRIADGQDEFKRFLDAVASGDTKSVRELLQRHPYFAQARGLWKIPLHQAINERHFDIAAMLVERGADPSMCDLLSGYTALHRAAWVGHAETVDALLASGADPQIRNFVEITPFGIAVAKGNYEAAARLMPDDAAARLWAQIATGGVGEVREALAKHPDLATSRPEGEATLLHMAAKKGETEIAELLLSSGADVNAADFSGWTPLMLAAYYNHLDCARLLLEHGAATDIKTYRVGKTALDYAKCDNHTEMMALLTPKTQ